MVRKLCWLLLFVVYVLPGRSQEKEGDHLKEKLDSLAMSAIPQLNETVNLSLSNIPLSEFMRAVSTHIGLNINVDPMLNIQVNNNFSGVKAKDILLMLCKEYKLVCNIYGNIINIKPEPFNNSFLKVDYDSEKRLLSFDLHNASLSAFTREVTLKSGLNFFLSGGAGSIQIDGFAKSMPAADALYGLGRSNNFIVRQENEHFFIIEPLVIEGNNSGRNSWSKTDELSGKVAVNERNLITIKGNQLSSEKLLLAVVGMMNISFRELEPLEGEKNLSLVNVDITAFLNSLVSGTKQTYKFQNGTLLVGARGTPEMKTTKLIKFYYRRVDSLLNVLPKNIFPNVELKEFPELNSLIITGDADLLDDAEQKLRDLDVSVPVVLIDVIILDVSNTEELKTGIEAGIAKGDETVERGGTLNPGIEYSMDAGSINNAISRLGLTKLGKVTPNFYVKLKALETNGVVDIRSTPQLSTLNGHSATLSIGETQYYEEKRNVYQGSLNPQLEALTSFLPVEAQLAVIIEPFVTGNGDVIMSIEVEQSNFTERFKEDAPPGLISRKFKSTIRVKNQEMVLLGGLEELIKEKSRTGMPGIAKVPVLSWFFTKRTSKNNKTRLNVFIKPTILY